MTVLQDRKPGKLLKTANRDEVEQENLNKSTKFGNF